MREWVDHMLKSPSACQSLEEWCIREESLLTAAMEEVFHAGNTLKAASLLGEKKGIQRIRAQLQLQKREEQSYVRLQEATGTKRHA